MFNNNLSRGKIFLSLFLSVFILLVLQIRPLIQYSYSQEPSAKLKSSANKGDVDKDTTIEDVKIIGNKRVEKELIEVNIDTKPGNKYSLEKIQKDIETIYKLGYFENVSAEYEKTDKGIILYYVVDEKPVVVDLRVSGNDKIKDKDIQAAIKVREGKIINMEDVVSSQEAIENLYAQKGYVGTKVNYEIEPLDVGTVGLKYEIKEGNKAYIKEVEIKGNQHISDDYLKDKIYTKPKSIFSFITQKGLYNIEEIKRDSERIRAHYLDKGYLDVNVSDPEITYDKDKKGYRVVFNVEEGKQYTVGTINLTGELIADEKKLLSVMKLKPDDIFSSIQLSNDISRLTTFYGDEGYAFANVNPDIQVDRDNLRVDISLDLEKQNKVYIRNIDITGNIHTRDKVIRREMSLQEQKPYSSSKINDIKKEVTRLGFFEKNVEVNTQRVPNTEDKLDVDVKVEEKPTGFFSIAGGFSSVEKILLAGQIQESNLFGYGKRLSLNAQIGGVTKIFSLDYQDLHFFDTDYTFDTTLFLNDRDYRDFTRKAYGLNIGFGKYIYKNLRARLAYRWENQDIQNVDRDARLIISEGKRKISSFTFGLIWDSRNNYLDPSSGNLSKMFIEYGGPFGGDTDFVKYTASTVQWIPVWWDTFFQVSGNYGIIDLQDTGNDLVVGERFFMGGPNSLRGFKYRRVGPRVPTEDGDYVIIGGVQQLLISADYVFPIISDAGLDGVIFFDVGNAFNDGESVTLNPSDLKRDVGFGFRWLSPLGPLRLELGFPVGNRLPGENPYEIQFTVGSLF